jgi:hypothetical protein
VRRRGRPKKTVAAIATPTADVAGVPARRGPGRPRKTVAAVATAPVARRRGRPARSATPAATQTTFTVAYRAERFVTADSVSAVLQQLAALGAADVTAIVRI